MNARAIPRFIVTLVADWMTVKALFLRPTSSDGQREPLRRQCQKSDWVQASKAPLSATGNTSSIVLPVISMYIALAHSSRSSPQTIA